jgi:hypothetical protein
MRSRRADRLPFIHSGCRVEIFAEKAEIPLARVSQFRESERGFQECVVLRSRITEFQVVVTTWRFWFFRWIFHIIRVC